MNDDRTIPRGERPVGYEIVRPDKTATQMEDEWFFKMVDEQVFAHPHGKRPKPPIRLQPSMKPLMKRRAKNKLAAKSRRRNRS